MKKLFCVLVAAVLMTFCFAGCGKDDDKNNGNNLATDASEAVDDAAEGAEDIVDDFTNGAVTDGDGVIGNEESSTDTGNNNGNNNGNDNNGTDNGGNTAATEESDTLM